MTYIYGPPPISTDDLVDAAMCLWESALSLESCEPGDMRHYWNLNGICAMRDQIRALAPFCHADWQTAHDAGDFDAPFDTEWCPNWLIERVVWNDDGATVRPQMISEK